MKKYKKLMMFTCIVTLSCNTETNKNPYLIEKQNDSLIVNNKIRNVKFVLSNGLPDYSPEGHFYDSSTRSLYVYFDNLIVNYSLDSNKISNGFILKNYSTVNKDSVIVEKVNERCIYIKTAAHNFIVNKSLTEWYDLNTILNDTTINYLPESRYKRLNHNIIIDFYLKDGKVVTKTVNTDTLKLKNIQEHWKVLKE